MRKLLMLALFFSCSSKQQDKIIVDCTKYRLTKHIVSRQYYISIDLPSQWTSIDTSTYGVNKNLISAKTIYSSDSNSRAFILVQDFKQAIRFNNDTNKMKEYLKAEVRETKNGRDSIYSIKSVTINKWTTVAQKSFIKGSDFVFFGQILSINDSKEVSLVLQVSSQNFEEGYKLLECIISSYHTGQ